MSSDPFADLFQFNSQFWLAPLRRRPVDYPARRR